MNKFETKVIKAEYGSAIKVKEKRKDGTVKEYIVRAPTIHELLKYNHIANNGDKIAAINYILSKCVLNEDNISSITDASAIKIIQYIEDSHNPLSIESYNERHKTQPSPLLVLLYKVMYFTGLTLSDLYMMTPYELLEHIYAAETALGVPFYTTENQYAETDPEKMSEYYDKAMKEVMRRKISDMSTTIANTPQNKSFK